jgi:BCCT family betaine/carnitine transporter
MFKNVNKALIMSAFSILAAVVVPIIVIPEVVVALISSIYSFIATDLAWLFLLLGALAAAGALILIFSRYGDIRLGGADAKPHYSTFTWISMNLCSALAAGILIFGMCEWMYYINTTPFGIEPGSPEAYEKSISYGMFHWGFSAWGFYLLPGVALGYLYWNKNSSDLRVSTLCSNIVGGDNQLHRFIRFLIDAIIVFGYFMAIMTTVGIGVPVIAKLSSHLLGIEDTFGFKVGVICVFGAFFILSTSKTIAKGMGIISTFNVRLSLAFFAFVLFAGDTAFILNNLTMSVGTTINDFIHMSFNSDSIRQTGFIQGWTIFYWAWYVALTFICGIWIARTSYGRTFKEIAIANCVWGAAACWISFGILGSYGISQELHHGIALSSEIGNLGNSGVTLKVLETLPLSTLCIAVFVILVFFNLATTATANGTSLSIYTSIGLKQDQEPDAKFKVFWSLLFLVVPLGLIILENTVEGLNILSTIQSMITISALPILFALVVLFTAFRKAIKTDLESGELFSAIDNNKKHKWE